MEEKTNNWIRQVLWTETKAFLVLQKMLFTLHMLVSAVESWAERWSGTKCVTLYFDFQVHYSSD